MTVTSQARHIPGFAFYRQDCGEHKIGGGVRVYILVK